MSGAVPRAAGLLVPLFSLRSPRDWGIGEIGDLASFVTWVASAGHRLVQLLPIMEMPAGERSPYAAKTAFALDPLYLSMDAVEDFAAVGLAPELEEALAHAHADAAIDYDAVRALKRAALERAFAHFLATEWQGASVRAEAFRAFTVAEAGWLEDFALFRALEDRHHAAAWTSWEGAVRDRIPAALADARSTLAREWLFHAYAQWQVAEQWKAARRAAAAAGVRLKGDLPFTVGTHSADVWSRRHEFAFDRTLGAPPDAFSATGQEWGLPVHRWDVVADGGFAWLRARVARAAALFDAFRVDHVVGFYRMYVFGGGSGTFVPDDEDAQLALGERLLTLVRDAAGATEVIGEDLGVVPPFVRHSLARLDIPGYRVLRWEEEGGVFRNPRGYPARSVATSGTHDTSALAVWWEEELDDDGRRALARVPAFATLATCGRECTPRVQEALLNGLYAAGSDLAVVPFPDAYGGRERINVPATVGAPNWGYRLPWTTTELAGAPGRTLADRLRALAARHGR